MKELTIIAASNFVNRLPDISATVVFHQELVILLTEGSRSMKRDRGTYFPFPVSVKKVSKDPASPPVSASGSGRPSGFRPCSSRYLREKSHIRRGFVVNAREKKEES
jgi:hypothetical protein